MSEPVKRLKFYHLLIFIMFNFQDNARLVAILR